MNDFVEDDFKRESLVSSSSTSSEDSIDSQLSIISHQSKFSLNSFGYKIENNPKEILLNEETNKKVSFSEQFLFFGPLILCLILLISGIVVFITVEQRNNKNQNTEMKFNYSFNLYPHENFTPISCPFLAPKNLIQATFARNELKCGLHRSPIIHIYYLSDPRPIRPGENLSLEDVLIPPIVQLHKEFLSKVNTKSFVLVLIDPELVPGWNPFVFLHWIRYFSSSLEDEEDICCYKSEEAGHKSTIQKIVLLYATNSSQMIIRAKTICNQMSDHFKLIEYIAFIKLKLIASTHFFVPYVKTPDY